MSLDRRTFLAGTAATTAAVATSCASRPAGGSVDDHPVLIATWPFGKFATERGRDVILAGDSVLDAVEQGVREIERRGSDGSVGVRGRPNAAGYTQVDACIMNGDDHGAGSVAGLEGIVHPVSAARLVMEKTKHVMLVGEGARWFALENGLATLDVSGHRAKKAAWRARQKDPVKKREGHDTIALLALDGGGHMAGACSTSGAATKLPGRVGDSPILGSGLYVDGEVGAAGATGIGENVMRYCATFHIVELMRAGRTPTEACEAVIHRIARKEGTYAVDICFVAVDRAGNVGAAASNQTFPFAVATRGTSELRKVPQVTPR
jgi:isoaspartyl peptidase/L-asparaginase-like protein (Ntn-hydrolase superfamily)